MDVELAEKKFYWNKKILDYDRFSVFYSNHFELNSVDFENF